MYWLEKKKKKRWFEPMLILDLLDVVLAFSRDQNRKIYLHPLEINVS